MLTALLLLAAAAHAESPYFRVAGQDLTTRTLYQLALLTDGESLTYNVYQPENPSYPISMIAAAVRDSSEESIREIRVIAPRAFQVSRPALNIYEISTDALNDPARFPAKFVEDPQRGLGPLWGFFDPVVIDGKVDAIVVSDHGLAADEGILRHEIAHRWYAAYCIDRYVTLTSEEFARRVEASLGR